MKKNLDFLSKNRLIYLFQKNIVKNNKFSKYFIWFEFAEKTRNPDNKKEDFIQYEKDEIFMAVMNRIRTDNLKTEDFQYIEDFEEFRRQVKIHEDVIRKEGIKEGMNKKDYSFVKNLLISTDFSDEKIALLVDVKVDFVKMMRKKYIYMKRGKIPLLLNEMGAIIQWVLTHCAINNTFNGLKPIGL